MTSQNDYPSRSITLSYITGEMKQALQSQQKWSTILDPDGRAEIFFKYYCTPIFTVKGRDPEKSRKLCYKLLKSVGLSKPLTINFLDYPYENIFDKAYFPIEVLNPAWLRDKKNISRLKSYFAQDFKEEVIVNPNFKLTFLFRKENIPPVLLENTVILKVVSSPGDRRRYENNQTQLIRSNQAKSEEKSVNKKISETVISPKITREVIKDVGESRKIETQKSSTNAQESKTRLEEQQNKKKQEEEKLLEKQYQLNPSSFETPQKAKENPRETQEQRRQQQNENQDKQKEEAQEQQENLQIKSQGSSVSPKVNSEKVRITRSNTRESAENKALDNLEGATVISPKMMQAGIVQKGEHKVKRQDSLESPKDLKPIQQRPSSQADVTESKGKKLSRKNTQETQNLSPKTRKETLEEEIQTKQTELLKPKPAGMYQKENKKLEILTPKIKDGKSKEILTMEGSEWEGSQRGYSGRENSGRENSGRELSKPEKSGLKREPLKDASVSIAQKALNRVINGEVKEGKSSKREPESEREDYRSDLFQEEDEEERQEDEVPEDEEVEVNLEDEYLMGQEEEEEEEDVEEDDGVERTSEEREARKLLRKEERIRKKYQLEYGELASYNSFGQKEVVEQSESSGKEEHLPKFGNMVDPSKTSLDMEAQSPTKVGTKKKKGTKKKTGTKKKEGKPDGSESKSSRSKTVSSILVEPKSPTKKVVIKTEKVFKRSTSAILPKNVSASKFKVLTRQDTVGSATKLRESQKLPDIEEKKRNNEIKRQRSSITPKLRPLDYSRTNTRDSLDNKFLDDSELGKALSPSKTKLGDKGTSAKRQKSLDLSPKLKKPLILQRPNSQVENYNEISESKNKILLRKNKRKSQNKSPKLKKEVIKEEPQKKKKEILKPQKSILKQKRNMLEQATPEMPGAEEESSRELTAREGKEEEEEQKVSSENMLDQKTMAEFKKFKEVFQNAVKGVTQNETQAAKSSEGKKGSKLGSKQSKQEEEYEEHEQDEQEREDYRSDLFPEENEDEREKEEQGEEEEEEEEEGEEKEHQKESEDNEEDEEEEQNYQDDKYRIDPDEEGLGLEEEENGVQEEDKELSNQSEEQEQETDPEEEEEEDDRQENEEEKLRKLALKEERIKKKYTQEYGEEIEDSYDSAAENSKRDQSRETGSRGQILEFSSLGGKQNLEASGAQSPTKDTTKDTSKINTSKKKAGTKKGTKTGEQGKKGEGKEAKPKKTVKKEAKKEESESPFGSPKKADGNGAKLLRKSSSIVLAKNVSASKFKVLTVKTEAGSVVVDPRTPSVRSPSPTQSKPKSSKKKGTGTKKKEEKFPNEEVKSAKKTTKEVSSPASPMKAAAKPKTNKSLSSTQPASPPVKSRGKTPIPTSPLFSPTPELKGPIIQETKKAKTKQKTALNEVSSSSAKKTTTTKGAVKDVKELDKQVSIAKQTSPTKAVPTAAKKASSKTENSKSTKKNEQ